MAVIPLQQNQPKKLVLMYWEGKLRLYRVNVKDEEALDMMKEGQEIIQSRSDIHGEA